MGRERSLADEGLDKVETKIGKLAYRCGFSDERFNSGEAAKR